ncbi:MAG: LysR substrate-binding domain-containing protein, partial [Alphaproteobacteria bacterium]
ADTRLRLFERVRGRLVPTAQGMRLYREIDRIFTGVRQVEQAVDAIRREAQGRLVVGVLPALSVSFIQRATVAFLRPRPQVFMSMMERSSEIIVDWVGTRQIDVGLVSFAPDNPFIQVERMMPHPLMCAMPLGHPLAGRPRIVPADLEGVAFISFSPTSPNRQVIDAMLVERGVRPNVVLEARTAPALAEFVAHGLGVSLIHPVFAAGARSRIVLRPFEPELSSAFYLCRAHDSRNAELVDLFIAEVRATAAAMAAELLSAP